MKTLSHRLTSLRARLAALCLAFVLGLAGVASATTYTVTTVTDHAFTTVNSANGQITGGAGIGSVSLRSAVIAANVSGVGPHTINVPAGTYNLSVNNPGTLASGTIALPDLEVGTNLSTVSIIGTGVTPSKIVQTVAGNDVITTGFKTTDGSPAIVNLTLNNLEITGGGFTGIFTGADDGVVGQRSSTTITNCNIHNNTNADASFGQGGAIFNQGGDLSISGSTFTVNSATNSSVGQGGAIYYNLPNVAGAGSVGTFSVTGCTFTGNTSAIGSTFPAGGAIVMIVSSPDASGGAIDISGNIFSSNQATGGGDGGAIAISNAPGRTVNILRNTFSGNTASNAAGHGGAIAVNAGTVNVTFNRFISNTVTTAANGSVLYHGNSDTVNANDNWWSRNTGPALNEIAGTAVTQANWLQLKLTALASTVAVGGSTTLTASFLSDSANNVISAANLGALIGQPITFGGGSFGTTSLADATIQAAGTAGATFTAGTTAGVSAATAQVDNAPAATTNITIPPTVTLNAATLAQSATSVVINGTGFSTTLPNNVVTLTGGTAGAVTAVNGAGTQLTVSVSGLIAGDLLATVTTNTVSSGVPVKVATVITSGPPAKLAFAQQPTNAVAGVAISPAVTVQIQDTNGILTNSTANVTIGIGTNAGGGTLSGTVTVAAVAGVATFSNLSIDKTGTGYTLAASSGALTGATSSTFNITPAATSQLAVALPVGDKTAGVPFNVSVTALDAFGNITPGYTGTVHFTTTDAGIGAAVPADYPFTAGDNGSHTFANGVSLVTASASATVTATDAGTPAITGVSALQTVNAAAATRLVVNAPATTTQGTPFSVTVTAQDAFGNTVTGYTGTVHFTKTDSGGGAAVPVDYPFVAGDNGTHTFAGGVTLVTVGSQTITATDTVNGALTGSANVTVLLPPAISAAFNPAQIVVGATTSLTYTITNPNGVPLTGVGFTQTLPAGLTVGNGTTAVGGGTRTTTVPDTITLTGATVPANGQLQFSVTVTGATLGIYNNVTTGAVTSGNGGTGNTATANTLTIVARPTVTVAFGVPTFGTGELTTLTYTVTNPNPAVALTGLAFTDVLPSGLVVATPNALVSNLNGTATAVEGTNVIDLAGGTLAGGASATLVVNITALTPGVKTGMFTVLTCNEAPVNTSPTFVPPAVATNARSTLTFARQIFTGTVGAADPSQTGRINRFATASVPGVNKAFPGIFAATGARPYKTHSITNSTGSPQDVMVWGFSTNATNGGFVVAYLDSFNPANIATNYLADAGSSFPSPASFGFTIPAGRTVVIVLHEVNAPTGFDYVLGINTPIPSSIAAVAALPSITVIPKPFLVQAFAGPYIPVNTPAPLTFTLINPGPSAFTNVSFTETLPAGLTIATPNGLAGSVGGGSLTATAGTGAIALSGTTVPANSQVQFTLNVVASTVGTKILTSSPVTSTEAGSGGFSYATVQVVAPPIFSMSFNPAQVPIGGTSSLDFTIVNPADNAVPLTGVGFTLTLPAGLTVASATSAQGGGTLTTTAPTSIALSGATVGVGGTLQFSVTVTAPSSGTFTATTGPITSAEGGNGLSAVATLTTNRPPNATPVFAARAPGGSVKIPVGQILAAALDPDVGDTVTLVSVGSPTAPAHGTATYTGNGSTGNVFYTPNAGDTAGDVFSYTVTDNHGAQATSTVNITIANSTGAVASQITKQTRAANGTVSLSFAGVPGYTVGVQFTDDLTHAWVNLGPLTMNGVGQATFTDSAHLLPGFPNVFYRLIYPAP